jgi:hypothetical protein
MNILSIDIDYLTCKYSNSTSFCSKNPRKKWDNVLKEFNNDKKILESFEIDYDNLSFLMSLFIKAMNNSKKVIFSVTHHAILQELEKNEYSNLNIINVDQHHDIVYGDEYDLFDLENYNIITCGNWVWKLQFLNKISSYHWIKNETSHTFNESITKGRLPNNYKVFLKNEIDYNIYDMTYDLLFVCLSPEYIAPNHWMYYDMMMKMYDEKTGEKVQFIQNIPEIRSDILSSCSNIFDYRLK